MDDTGATPPEPRVVLRPVATPLPLAFGALAVASAALSALQLHWLPPTQDHVVALAVLVGPVPLMAVAACLGFLARDPVAGTGTALSAAAWAGTAAVTSAGPGQAHAPGLGVVLIATAAALVAPVAAGRSTVLSSAVTAVTGVRFALTGLGLVTASSPLTTAAGGCGLLLSALALYGSLAFELEGVHLRTVLPVGRAAASRRALAGAPGAGPSADVDREAGVRRPL